MASCRLSAAVRAAALLPRLLLCPLLRRSVFPGSSPSLRPPSTSRPPPTCPPPFLPVPPSAVGRRFLPPGFQRVLAPSTAVAIQHPSSFSASCLLGCFLSGIVDSLARRALTFAFLLDPLLFNPVLYAALVPVKFADDADTD